MIVLNGQAKWQGYLYISPVKNLTGKPMTKYIILGLLTLTTIICAVFEGLLDLSPQFVQFSGAVSLIFTLVLIGSSLMIKTDDVRRD